MARIWLTLFVLSPLVVVGGLWLSIDPSRGHPGPVPGATGLPRHGVPGGVVPAPQPAGTMVRPEFLEQGYIFVVKDLTGLANADSPIYLASSYNGWDPGDAKRRLSPRSDGRWQIAMPRAASDAGIEFKFTRGNWDLEELDAELKPISNRTLPLIDASKLGPGEAPVFEFEVPKWGDQRPTSGARPDLDPYHELQVTGTVRRLQVPGGVAGLRDVLVWLPPGYDDAANASRRYPVLYLHDGQNVFEQLPGVPGEWGADETATELVRTGAVAPLIIVAVPHAGAGATGRLTEYTPVPMLDGVEARGAEHVAFLADQVVPRVQRAFRVLEGPEHTVVGGSSLGAVISLYAAVTRPELFGAVLLESPAVMARPDVRAASGVGGAGQPPFLAWLAQQERLPRRVYLAVGDREGGLDASGDAASTRYVQGTRELEALFERRGVTGTDRLVIVEPGAVHNEGAWQKRFGRALAFLFPGGGG